MTDRKEWQSIIDPFLPTFCWQAVNSYGTAIDIDCGEKIIKHMGTRSYPVGAFSVSLTADSWTLLQNRRPIYFSLYGTSGDFDKIKSAFVGSSLNAINACCEHSYVTLEFANGIEFRVDHSRTEKELDNEYGAVTVFLPNGLILCARYDQDFVILEEKSEVRVEYFKARSGKSY